MMNHNSNKGVPETENNLAELTDDQPEQAAGGYDADPVCSECGARMVEPLPGTDEDLRDVKWFCPLCNYEIM